MGEISKRTWRPPQALGWAVRRTRELADPWIPDGPDDDADVPGPLPPRRLRARAGAAGGRAFWEGGRRTAMELARLLADAGGADIATLGSALDFGCGAGRVLPHFARLVPACACIGCDIDETAVQWAARSHPRLGWSLTSFHPPLPYEPERFELIYAAGVFSHFDRGLAALWLDELTRVLTPGGIALLSVHGAHAFDAFREGQVPTSWCAPGAFARGPLRDDEHVFAPYVRSFWNDGELPGVGRGYGLAFQGAGHARRAWPRSLQVVEVRERALNDWQDVVICRKC